MNDLRTGHPQAVAGEEQRRAFSPADATDAGAVRDGTWIVTDGSVGMEAQGIAVAEAVGLPYALKRVRTNGVMRLVPARLQIYLPPAFACFGS